MTIRNLLYAGLISIALAGCHSKNNVSDASGSFEIDEVVVSAEVPGKILSLNLEEGS